VRGLRALPALFQKAFQKNSNKLRGILLNGTLQKLIDSYSLVLELVLENLIKTEDLFWRVVFSSKTSSYGTLSRGFLNHRSSELKKGISETFVKTIP
jgi:hypothetical protein